MVTQVEFLGPVHIYARRVGLEWEAWADPFSVVGDGATREKAIEKAQRNVEDYLSALAETLHQHGARADVLTPLEPELRKGRPNEYLVYACRHVRTVRRRKKRVQDLNRRNLVAMLREGAELGVVPLAVAG